MTGIRFATYCESVLFPFVGLSVVMGHVPISQGKMTVLLDLS